MKQNYAASLRSQSKTYQNASQQLQLLGYATDPNYALNMINRIQRYQLNALD